MKPASDADTATVLAAVEVGDPIPEGFAFDGAAVYVLDAQDEQRIEDEGPVMPPDSEAPLVEGTPATTTTTTAAPKAASAA